MVEATGGKRPVVIVWIRGFGARCRYRAAMSTPNGSGRHDGGAVQARRRRNLLIVGVIVLAILAFGGGYLLASGGGEDAASPSPSRSHSPRPTKEPSATASPSASASASVPPSPSPVLEDGRHFVYPKEAVADGTWSLTFDLAYFLTDDDAADACGPDVPNGYCIVNDNPKLRTLPVARSVAVRYIPVDHCCVLRPGNFPAFASAVEDTDQTDYDPTAPYWITVQGDEVVRIAQQYLP